MVWKASPTKTTTAYVVVRYRLDVSAGTPEPPSVSDRTGRSEKRRFVMKRIVRRLDTPGRQEAVQSPYAGTAETRDRFGSPRRRHAPGRVVGGIGLGAMLAVISGLAGSTSATTSPTYTSTYIQPTSSINSTITSPYISTSPSISICVIVICATGTQDGTSTADDRHAGRNLDRHAGRNLDRHAGRNLDRRRTELDRQPCCPHARTLDAGTPELDKLRLGLRRDANTAGERAGHRGHSGATLSALRPDDAHNDRRGCCPVHLRPGRADSSGSTAAAPSTFDRC